MLPYWLIVAMMAVPCNSAMEYKGNEAIVHQCPAPQLQGPPRPPLGWRPGMMHDTNREILERKAVKTPKYAYKKKPNKKKRKNRR